MNHNSPDPALVDPAPTPRRLSPLLAFAAIPLLLADWWISLLILDSTCTLPYEGGNMTACLGGLLEEEMLATSAFVALALFLIQVWLIAKMRRRTH